LCWINGGVCKPIVANANFRIEIDTFLLREWVIRMHQAAFGTLHVRSGKTIWNASKFQRGIGKKLIHRHCN
jgi:hypothetical protein